MPLVSDQDKADLKRRFRKELKRDVTIKLFTTTPSPLTLPGRDCPTCPQTQGLLQDLAALSPKLRLETYDFFSPAAQEESRSVERIPAIVMDCDTGSRLKFYGLPAGYQIAALVQTLIAMSRRVSPLALPTRRELRKVNRPVHIQVFVTATSPACPSAAALAYAVALESGMITADVVEAREFPNLTRLHNVSSVPKTVINETLQLAGPPSEAQLLEKVMQVGYVRPQPAPKGA